MCIMSTVCVVVICFYMKILHFHIIRFNSCYFIKIMLISMKYFLFLYINACFTKIRFNMQFLTITVNKKVISCRSCPRISRATRKNNIFPEIGAGWQQVYCILLPS